MSGVSRVMMRDEVWRPPRIGPGREGSRSRRKGKRVGVGRNTVSHDVHETSVYSAARTGSEPGRVVTSTSTSTRIYCFTESEVWGWAGGKAML